MLDTEGPELPADVAQAFRATGPITDTKIRGHIGRLHLKGIHVERLSYGDGNAGHITAIRPSRDKQDKPDYQIRLNATHELNVQFVTLVHELGHLFLGHLGPDAYLRIAERPRPQHGQRELEAESLAYLVCKRRGVTSKSESYLAHYVATHTTVDALDLDTLLKAAGQVEAILNIAAETPFGPMSTPGPKLRCEADQAGPPLFTLSSAFRERMNQQALSSFIWSVADLLRGDYKQSEYGRVILPFTVLRRLDCVLADTKAAALAELAERRKAGLNPAPFLLRVTGRGFYNTSPLDMQRLMGDQDHIAANLEGYIQGFSPDVRDIFERFDFFNQVDRLARAGLLYQVTERFANIDLHPDRVDNHQMGLVFEELIRRFAEISNETAGEHFTPRDAIRLMVNLLFIEDDQVLSRPGTVRTIYDPTAGTGGMLSVAGEYLAELNPQARLTMFGQELNPESYAICKADMLIKGQDVSNIVFGNTLSADGLLGKLFDYMFSNPPFGVEWKKIESAVRKEHQQNGFAGRFGPGLPRVSDGSLLFLLHLISKMRPAVDGGSRLGIVLNGSPLFTGAAGSGESEIRRYVLENDLVEAIVGLPTDMFYNTGINTYVWVLSNRKPEHRKGKVQLIDASPFWQKMRKSLGSKRKEMSEEHIALVTKLFGDFAEARLATLTDVAGKEVGRQVLMPGETEPAAPQDEKGQGKVRVVPISRIFPNTAFGYRTITVERPLRDETGALVLGQKGKGKGKPQPDPKLRDTENVPLAEDVAVYFKREVLPHAPDAWIDHDKTKVGYEIPFNRHFYVFEPPRPLEVIDAHLTRVTDGIKAMIEGLTA